MAKASTYPQDESLSLTDKLFGTDGSLNKNYTIESLIDYFYVQLPRLKITSKTADYTAESFDFVQMDATSGNKIVSLPLSPATNDLVSVIKSDVADTSVAVSGNGKNINGTTTTVLVSQYDVVNLIYNGTQWIIK